jgi:hypothetical protein
MRWPSRCLPRSLHAAGHKAHNLHWITYMTAVDGHFHNHAWIEGNAGGRRGDEHRRGQRLLLVFQALPPKRTSGRAQSEIVLVDGA